MVLTRLVLAILICGRAGAADAVYPVLEKAYESLRSRDYDNAIRYFQTAIEKAPDRVDIRKDLAYTYLRTGEPERARDQFRAAMELAPEDEHLALEYAFLCYETKQQATARRIFDRIRRGGNPTAQRAFDNIDSALARGIARWTRAVELSPDHYSAHHELARLAEQRDELALAAEHYHRAWLLRREVRSLLLDLGRVWKQQGDLERAHAALLAASRGAEPRTAEAARALLPDRYPYVYEFRQALELDPENLELRRELAYLHLEMGHAAEAEAEFDRIVKAAPEDSLSAAQLGFLLLARREEARAIPLLQAALEKAGDDELADRIRTALGLPKALRKRAEVPRSQTSAEAREMAERSLQAGYFKDALKYLRIAHENDPIDFNIMLKLGWTHNLLRDDRQAVEWFRLAARSPKPAEAAEARQAYANLHPAFARIRTSAWFFPMYSSRWRDVFTYAQFKTDLMPSWPVHPYISTRFSGDTRRTLPSISGPQYLSESAGILGAGVETRTWRGLRVWGEYGVAVSYLRRTDSDGAKPDARAGVSYLRSLGRNLGSRRGGLFAEASADAVYLSRFDRDTIAYYRLRSGYTLRSSETVQLQLCWNANGTSDTRRYQWANTFEMGPGIRVHWRALPRPLLFSADALEGRHTVLDGTRPPRYSDLRIGIWYAFSR